MEKRVKQTTAIRRVPVCRCRPATETLRHFRAVVWRRRGRFCRARPPRLAILPASCFGPALFATFRLLADRFGETGKKLLGGRGALLCFHRGSRRRRRWGRLAPRLWCGSYLRRRLRSLAGWSCFQGSLIPGADQLPCGGADHRQDQARGGTPRVARSAAASRTGRLGVPARSASCGSSGGLRGVAVKISLGRCMMQLSSVTCFRPVRQ